MANERQDRSKQYHCQDASPSDVRAVISRARVYLDAAAWQSAHDLLEPATTSEQARGSRDQEVLEALGLLLVACTRLGHIEHVAGGTATLREALALNVPMTPEARALATMHTLRQMVDRGNYAHAVDAAVVLRESLTDNVTIWTRVRIELSIAWLSARLGELDAAERAALQAVLLAEESRSDSLLADALVAVANVRSARRDPEGAQRVLARAVECYWRVGDGLGRTLALIGRGVALFVKGDVAASAAVLAEAEASALSLGRRDSLLRARLGLGWLAARGGRTHEARRLLLPACRVADQLGMKRERALAFEYLAEAYLWASDSVEWLPQARMALSRCRQCADAIDPEGDISVECSIREATLACAEGRSDSAEQLALAAVEHARRRQLRWEEAEAWRVVGLARVGAGRLASACEALDESHSRLVAIGEHFQRWYVEAWQEVLASEDRGRLHDGSIQRVHGRLGAGSQGSATATEPQHTDDLKHWLWHPLMGPLAWRAKRHPASGADAARQAPSSMPVGPPAANAEPCMTWSTLGLITRSPALRDTLLLAETYATESIPILILGETGTGKDILARGLHDLSGRSGRLVPVNCAAAQRHLFAAELFGARRGAYTGAVDHRRGLIHEAAEGTIFFDEIADLDPEAQGYLLRFLDSGEVRPLGDTKGERIETRVLAATRRDLHALVAAGSFREDLYMRLAAVILVLPPLRDRLVDLPLLIEALWLRAGGAPGDREAVFTPEVLRELRHRPWPGNVRELSHIVSQSIPLLRARGAPAARARIQSRAGLGWHDGSQGPGQARSHPASSSDAGSTAARLDAGGGSGRDSTLAPTNVTPLGEASAISPSPHRILAKDPEGNWPESLLRNALDVAKGHVPTAARILGISRSQAYRLYKQLRGTRG